MSTATSAAVALARVGAKQAGGERGPGACGRMTSFQTEGFYSVEAMNTPGRVGKKK